jgi:hypothetical protein
MFGPTGGDGIQILNLIDQARTRPATFTVNWVVTTSNAPQSTYLPKS